MQERSPCVYHLQQERQVGVAGRGQGQYPAAVAAGGDGRQESGYDEQFLNDAADVSDARSYRHAGAGCGRDREDGKER